jgi:hypothetical protein
MYWSRELKKESIAGESKQIKEAKRGETQRHSEIWRGGEENWKMRKREESECIGGHY